MKKRYIISAFAAMAIFSGCENSATQTASQGIQNDTETATVATDRTGIADATGTNDVVRSENGNSEQVQNLDGDDANSNVDTPVTPAELPKEAGWYMRTVVSAVSPSGKVYVHNTAGVFGELDDSSDNLDNHDIESIGQATLQVRFINSQLEVGKEYFSDYRSYKGELPEREVWTFLIKNERGEDLSQSTFKLDLEAPKRIVRRPQDNKLVEVGELENDIRNQLTLVDADNGKTYTYEEAKNMVFSMEGQHTRVFRWVIGRVTKSDLIPIDIMKAGMNAGSEQNRPTQFSSESAMAASASKFGLPPSI
jgi:hypothetical protein